jgi:glycosyltransferase involved in cell wall biosynthesis
LTQTASSQIGARTDAAAAAPPLPRLLYVGDVTVESTSGGSALLYRLLEQYPKDRLRIVQNHTFGTKPDARIPGVTYDPVSFGKLRILHTRFAGWYSAYLLTGARKFHRDLLPLAREFKPDAVLTVAHRFLWRTADALAEALGVPLHLIVHDDVHQMAHTPGLLNRWVDKEFRRVFRRAASRLCVSPYMAELYGRRYDAPADVVYPSRASDVPVFTDPPPRVTSGPAVPGGGAGLTFAFAGTVNSAGMAKAITDLADVLGRDGGRLVLYSNVAPGSNLGRALDRPYVSVRAMVPFKELIARLRDEADVLFAPVSFADDDRANMEICFPSKLTDYTAAGVPVLVWGPAYSSAVRWANDNPGVAEVVTEQDAGALAGAVRRLSADAARRASLGRAALDVGRRYFAYEVGAGRLTEVLLSSRNREGRH